MKNGVAYITKLHICFLQSSLFFREKTTLKNVYTFFFSKQHMRLKSVEQAVDKQNPTRFRLHLTFMTIFALY